jgi:type IX secretion system substrate protein
MGEKIIAKQIPVSQNYFSVDVSAVPQGMYFMKVITGKGTVNKKVQVVKK